MKKITVEVGTADIHFEVNTDDFNRFINEQMPNDKVGPAFNFLTRTVVDSDRDALKKVAMTDGKPNGLIVMQIAGIAAEQFGGGVEISLKKPSQSLTK